jgi:hypothetical protein
MGNPGWEGGVGGSGGSGGTGAPAHRLKIAEGTSTARRTEHSTARQCWLCEAHARKGGGKGEGPAGLIRGGPV